MNKLCKLVEKVSEIDYKGKTQSIISVCDKGTGNEQLLCPYGVIVDPNTGNIYVADNHNDCVKVFDKTAKYLLKFGNRNGEGKMSYPKGLLIRGNKVFVSHNDCILVYQLDGMFVSRIGSEGNGKLQFNCPWGLQLMNPIMKFIFVTKTTIEFKLSLKTFITSLNSVRILYTTLLILHSTKTTSLS